MAQNKVVRFGPVALTTTLTTNILNPQALTGGVGMPAGNTYIIIKHMRIVNKTGGASTFSLWIGATGGNVAGTEFAGISTTVPANSAVDWYGSERLDVADFLVGGAANATTLTFNAEGEIGIA